MRMASGELPNSVWGDGLGIRESEPHCSMAISVSISCYVSERGSQLCLLHGSACLCAAPSRSSPDGTLNHEPGPCGPAGGAQLHSHSLCARARVCMLTDSGRLFVGAKVWLSWR